jgi:type I restriction enzyme S subunit
MREMKESHIPFCENIPINWSEIPNKYIFSCHSTKVGDKSSEYQLLSLTTSGVKEKSATASGGKVPTSYDGYQTVEIGDMIFCLFDLDCSAVFSGLSPYNGMITSAYDVLRANPNRADNHFLEYWFQYVFSNRYYKMFSKNIRYTVTGEMFNSIYTPIPPIEEQKKIGSYLDKLCKKVDALIANQEAQIEKLKAYRQSLITEVVTKGLDPNVPMKDSGVEWIGKVPQDWQIVKTGRLFKENNRKPNGTEIPLSLSQADGLIATEDMKESSLKTSTYDNWKRVEIGDLVLNRFKAHLGVLFNATLSGIVSFHYGVYEAKLPLITKYYEYLYHSEQYRAILGNASNGMVVGLQNLSNLNFYSTWSLNPPLEVQTMIVDYLDKKCARIDSLIALKREKIDKLNQYKKTFIYEYVTGKKEVM